MEESKKILFRVRAKHTYNANQSDELSFKGGDMIDVYSKGDGDGWWEGSIVGDDTSFGLFPSNYVRKIPKSNKAGKRPIPPKLPVKPSSSDSSKKNKDIKLSIEKRLEEIVKLGKPSTYLDVKKLLIDEYGEKSFESCKLIVQTRLRDKSKAPEEGRKKTRKNSVFNWKPSQEDRKSLKLTPSQISQVTSMAAKRSSKRRESLESAERTNLTVSNQNRFSTESSPMIAPPPTPDTPPYIAIPPGVPPGVALARKAFESTTPTNTTKTVVRNTSSPSLPPKRPRENKRKPEVGLNPLSGWVNSVATRYSCTVASSFFAFGVESEIITSLQKVFGSRPSSKHRNNKFPPSERGKIRALHARPKLPSSSSLEDAVRRLPITPSLKLCAFPDLNKDELVELRPHIPNDISSPSSPYSRLKKKRTPKASEFHTFVVSDPNNRRIRGGCLVMYDPIAIIPCAEYVVSSNTLCRKFRSHIEKETRFGSLIRGADITSTQDFEIFRLLKDAIDCNSTCSQRYTAAQAVCKTLANASSSIGGGGHSLMRKARPLTTRISKEKMSRLQSYHKKGSQDDLFLHNSTVRKAATTTTTDSTTSQEKRISMIRNELERKIQEMFGAGASKTTRGALRMLAADHTVSDEDITNHVKVKELSVVTKLAIQCIRFPTCKNSPLIELYESLRRKIEYTLKRCWSCHLIFQIPLALVLMGPFPRYGSMERVLSDISEYVRVRAESSGNSSMSSVSVDLDDMLRRLLWQIPPPSRGLWRLHFRLRQGGQLISLARSPCNALPDGLEMTCLVTLLFRKLNPRDLLLVYGALLMEERIILASKDMNISAACAEALQSLLYPLVIRVPFITTLPSQLRSTITNHKSCLIGVTNKTLGQCTESEHDEISRLCLVVHLDTGRLDLSKNLSRCLNTSGGHHRNSVTNIGMLKITKESSSNSLDGTRILPSKMYEVLYAALRRTASVNYAVESVENTRLKFAREISRVLRPLQSIVERDVCIMAYDKISGKKYESFKGSTPIQSPTMPKSLRRGHSRKAMKLLGDSSNESTNMGTYLTPPQREALRRALMDKTHGTIHHQRLGSSHNRAGEVDIFPDAFSRSNMLKDFLSEYRTAFETASNVRDGNHNRWQWDSAFLLISLGSDNIMTSSPDLTTPSSKSDMEHPCGSGLGGFGSDTSRRAICDFYFPTPGDFGFPLNHHRESIESREEDLEGKTSDTKSSENIVTVSRLFMKVQDVMKTPNELACSQFPTLPLAPLTGCTRSRCIESLKTTCESLKLMMACSPRLYRCWGAKQVSFDVGHHIISRANAMCLQMNENFSRLHDGMEDGVEKWRTFTTEIKPRAQSMPPRTPTRGIVNAEKTLLRGLRNFMNSLFFGSMQKFAAKLGDRVIEPLRILSQDTDRVSKKLFQDLVDQGRHVWKLKADTESVRRDAYAGRFREQWLRRQLQIHADKYIRKRRLQVHVCSWNINARTADAIELDDWLRPEHFSDSSPDIVVVGLQEMVELNVTHVMMDKKESDDRGRYWTRRVTGDLRRLYPGCPYKLVKSKVMVGCFVVVFVAKKHASAVHCVSASSDSTGYGGILGNKGAVAVRMQLYESTLAVVCAHLAAHRKHVEARNADFAHIREHLTFKFRAPVTNVEQLMSVDNRQIGKESYVGTIKSADTPSLRTLLGTSNDALTERWPPKGTFGADTRPRNYTEDLFDSSGAKTPSSPLYMPQSMNSGEEEEVESSMLDHDTVIFFGDLNYRIVTELSKDTVLHLSKANTKQSLQELKENDQLNIERRDGRVFQGFSEGEIHFPPTYKMQIGAGIYEEREGKKHRAPAWCDRVLWYCSRTIDETDSSSLKKRRRGSSMTGMQHVQLLEYDSVPSLKISDHLPVYAVLSVEIKTEKLQPKLDTLELISTQLAKWERNLLPEREAARLNLQWEDMRQGRLSGTKKTSEKEQIVRTDLKFGWSCAKLWYGTPCSMVALDSVLRQLRGHHSDQMNRSIHSLTKASASWIEFCNTVRETSEALLKVQSSVLPLKLANDSERAYNMYKNKPLEWLEMELQTSRRSKGELESIRDRLGGWIDILSEIRTKQMHSNRTRSSAAQDSLQHFSTQESNMGEVPDLCAALRSSTRLVVAAPSAVADYLGNISQSARSTVLSSVQNELQNLERLLTETSRELKTMKLNTETINERLQDHVKALHESKAKEREQAKILAEFNRKAIDLPNVHVSLTHAQMGRISWTSDKRLFKSRGSNVYVSAIPNDLSRDTGIKVGHLLLAVNGVVVTGQRYSPIRDRMRKAVAPVNLRFGDEYRLKQENAKKVMKDYQEDVAHLGIILTKISEKESELRKTHLSRVRLLVDRLRSAMLQRTGSVASRIAEFATESVQNSNNLLERASEFSRDVSFLDSEKALNSYDNALDHIKQFYAPLKTARASSPSRSDSRTRMDDNDDDGISNNITKAKVESPSKPADMRLDMGLVMRRVRTGSPYETGPSTSKLNSGASFARHLSGQTNEVITCASVRRKLLHSFQDWLDDIKEEHIKMAKIVEKAVHSFDKARKKQAKADEAEDTSGETDVAWGWVHGPLNDDEKEEESALEMLTTVSRMVAAAETQKHQRIVSSVTILSSLVSDLAQESQHTSEAMNSHVERINTLVCTQQTELIDAMTSLQQQQSMDLAKKEDAFSGDSMNAALGLTATVKSVSAARDQILGTVQRDELNWRQRIHRALVVHADEMGRYRVTLQRSLKRAKDVSKPVAQTVISQDATHEVALFRAVWHGENIKKLKDPVAFFLPAHRRDSLGHNEPEAKNAQNALQRQHKVCEHMVELLSEYTSLASRSAEMKSEKELNRLCTLLGKDNFGMSLGNWHSKIVNLIKLLVETYRKARNQAARLCKVQEARMVRPIQHLKEHLEREIENASKLRKRAHDEDSTDFTSYRITMQRFSESFITNVCEAARFAAISAAKILLNIPIESKESRLDAVLQSSLGAYSASSDVLKLLQINASATKNKVLVKTHLPRGKSMRISPGKLLSSSGRYRNQSPRTTPDAMTPYSKKMATLDLMLGAAPELPLRTDMGNIPDYVRRCFKDESDCVMLMGHVRKTSIKGLTSNFLAARKRLLVLVRGASGTRLLYFNSENQEAKGQIPKSGVLGGGIHLRLCKDAGSFEIEVKSGRLITYRLEPIDKTTRYQWVSAIQILLLRQFPNLSEIMKSAKQKIDLAENEAIGFDEEETF